MHFVKLTKITVLIVFALLILPLGVHAAPVISAENGTFTHGQTVTVTGSGFGTKSPVAPLQWDPVDGMYSSISQGATVPTGGSNPWNSSGGSDMYDPSFTITNTRGKFIAKYTNASSPSSVKNAVLGEKSWSQCAGAKLYLSYWVYPHQNPSNPGASNKYLRITDNGGWSSNVSFMIWDAGSGNILTYNLATDYTGIYYQSTNGTVGAWNRLEVVIDNSVNPKPSVKASVNNATVVSFQSSPSLPANLTGIYTIGADWTNAQSSPIAQLDWGEIYVDSTLARVEICNAATKTSSNHCEIQIPRTQWIDGQLQIQVNQGSFANGSTAYLYVVDASGNVSAGSRITFGTSGTSGTEPPSAPILN